MLGRMSDAPVSGSGVAFENDHGNLLPLTTPTSECLTFWSQPSTSFRFVDENGTRDVLVLHRDGRVEVGSHLTPDDAGRKVFESLRSLWAQHMGAGEKRYSLAEIKGAFWAEFHESGARDFSIYDKGSDTDAAWKTFCEKLEVGT